MICDPNPFKHPQPQHAVGYDFEPLPNKEFLFELYGDDGYTFAEAVLNRDQLESLPNVIRIVLRYVDDHGYPAYSYTDLPNRHRDEIARTRREAMDEAGKEKRV
jgi:hypothetical protein